MAGDFEKLKSSLGALAVEMEGIKSNKHPTFDSIQIGRWVIQVESGDSALVIRDTKSSGDKRYAFYNGGQADMYTSGVGGDIGVNKILFRNRWSIGEETTFLVFRERVSGGDKRYAMFANTYRDL